MNCKVDRGLLPIKAHFFFFFAALGPLLPQLNVFGRQLGVSPGAMGLVTAVLPLLWATAKPAFGYLVDYFTNQRKLIFMLLIATMTGSYCCLWFLPESAVSHQNDSIEKRVFHLDHTVYLQRQNGETSGHAGTSGSLEEYLCHWTCNPDEKFSIYLSNSTYSNTIYLKDDMSNVSCSLLHMSLLEEKEGRISCNPLEECDLICLQDDLVQDNFTVLNVAVAKNISKREVDDIKSKKAKILEEQQLRSNVISIVLTQGTVGDKSEEVSNFYMTATFWCFVVFMCVGTVAFNVANCIGDAVCFDVLGARAADYGWQRAWGTLGYGLTALLGGWLVDLVSREGPGKVFAPAFALAAAFTCIDLLCCRALKLPSLAPPAAPGALGRVLRSPRVLLFIVFAVVAGTLDSFIIYYMFWFLEELAEQTGHTAKIKLIEGAVVAAESFFGELLFFALSGRIISRWGYRATMTFSLLCYAIRLALISLITNPWQLVAIEGVLQGPSYALCYSCIVGYAAAVAPGGYSATVQGIVAGMDDGVGFALGSLVGGALYSGAGGRLAFRLMGGAASAACLLHMLTGMIWPDARGTDPKPTEPQELADAAETMLPLAQRDGVYRDAVTNVTIDGFGQNCGNKSR